VPATPFSHGTRRLGRRFYDIPLPCCNLDVFAAFAGLLLGARPIVKGRDFPQLLG
jgi:hypothetical protein